jgi:hypothetical protein
MTSIIMMINIVVVIIIVVSIRVVVDQGGHPSRQATLSAHEGSP